ncbi:MAG TPA: hypothetical protein VGO78_21050 [Acidimicrobiales bacterium]|jgi:hypothetical protein|nr:hypothetical protein [Acidimicrobiales bacterium]
MERRTVLRGALTLPVVAAALKFGSGPASMPATSQAGPAAASPSAARPGSSGSQRVRSWDVETLDRRLRVARS